MEWNYIINDSNNNVIMSTKIKIFNFTDCYEIVIKNDKDCLLVLK